MGGVWQAPGERRDPQRQARRRSCGRFAALFPSPLSPLPTVGRCGIRARGPTRLFILFGISPPPSSSSLPLACLLPCSAVAFLTAFVPSGSASVRDGRDFRRGRRGRGRRQRLNLSVCVRHNISVCVRQNFFSRRKGSVQGILRSAAFEDPGTYRKLFIYISPHPRKTFRFPDFRCPPRNPVIFPPQTQ